MGVSFLFLFLLTNPLSSPSFPAFTPPSFPSFPHLFVPSPGAREASAGPPPHPAPLRRPPSRARRQRAHHKNVRGQLRLGLRAELAPQPRERPDAFFARNQENESPMLFHPKAGQHIACSRRRQPLPGGTTGGRRDIVEADRRLFSPTESIISD